MHLSGGVVFSGEINVVCRHQLIPIVMPINETRKDSSNRDKNQPAILPPLAEIVRVVAWTLAIGSLGVVAIRYESLPSELPVSRWHSGAKTWLLALRIPIINCLTLGLVEILRRSLLRLGPRFQPNLVVSILLVTGALKAAAEAIELLMLPNAFGFFPLVLMVGVLTGVVSAVWAGRFLLRDDNWKRTTTTGTEKLACGLLILGIITFEMPLIFS